MDLGMRLAMIVAAVGFSSVLPALAAAQIRTSTDQEMAGLLSGCWTQQTTSFEKRVELAGYFNTHELCFLPHGKVEMWSLGGNKYGLEGMGADGHFRVASGRLYFSGELQDGWLFVASRLSCDVLMVPGRAMKLHNCASQSNSAGSEPDTTFFWKGDALDK